MITNSEAASILKDKNIRPTQQRISVYRFLKGNKTHPTADDIYLSLLPDYPSFSKTTIYNSLNALVSAGLVIVVTIDGTEVRYDADISVHGHFKCVNCGKIIDFEIEDIVSNDPSVSNALVLQKDVYYRGLCEECNK